jgi:hypothetical protein
MYYWFWHDLLHLNQPISWLIVNSIKGHLLVWDIAGALVLSTGWVLIMHFVKMT